MKNVVVCCVYRAPGGSVDIFNEKWEDLLNTLSGNKKTVYVCGDFNLDLLNAESHSKTQTFVDIMFSTGFYPLITKPSRISEYSATLIDNILTNDLSKVKRCGLLISDMSDHLPVFMCSEHVVNHKQIKSYVYKRVLKHENLLKLNDCLEQNDWSCVMQCDDVESAYVNFINMYKLKLNSCCPVKKCEVKSVHKQKPWITKGLENALKKKNNLYKHFLKCKTTASLMKYKHYKNKLTSILRYAQRCYYDKLLCEKERDIKGTWKVLNSLIKGGNTVTSYPDKFICNDKCVKNKKDIANGFNNFFTNVGPSLARKIISPANGSVYPTMGESNLHSMFLKPVSEHELWNVFSSCKNKKSTDIDDVSMDIVKSTVGAIIKPFVHICNLSFSTGVFPKDMKIAKIIPLFKSGDDASFSNYRPVSLLPQFSKVLEKLFDVRLSDFIEKYKILSNSQYGFRKGRSTSLALIDFMEKLSSGIDNNLVTVGVFIDLKKAFDTIDHTLLIDKLNYYGIRGTASDWLKSYLSQRKQLVNFNDTHSESLEVICGVPQGSILGPKLFTLYINDICNISKVLDFIIFADDTNIFCTGNDLIETCKRMSTELEKLQDWFALNKLSLNVTKTNFMVF